MKINISKDWLISRAQHEEGLEIGAGALGRSHATDISFGRFTALMRRKLGWSLARLAAMTETSPSELIRIEENRYHEPDAGAVAELARVFGLPVRALLSLAGVSADSAMRLREESMLPAMHTEVVEPLSEAEAAELRLFLQRLADGAQSPSN